MDDFRQDVHNFMTRDGAGENQTGGYDFMNDQEKFNQMFAVAMDNYRDGLQDNDAGEWSAEARKWAEETGLFVGGDPTETGEPNFMWGDFLTREQAAMLFYRVAQKNGWA
jgi:hypothetical protein